MTTPTVTTGKAASAQTKAAESAVSAVPETGIKPINRREFLFYIWGASIAVLMAQSAGAIIWFALPRFRAGEYGGIFPVDAGSIPAKGSPPVLNPDGKYWLSNTDNGVLALSATCTHLGCLFKWSDVNNRFECPCHGSKFQATGKYIEGPAPRNLDRFSVQVVGASGPLATTDATGDPVKIDGAVRLDINTGKKIKGEAHG